jgi:N-acylneuraminate cytidylyltransferase
MIGYVVPGGVDIDALKDVEYLEFYIKGHGNEILDELKKNYQPL